MGAQGARPPCGQQTHRIAAPLGQRHIGPLVPRRAMPTALDVASSLADRYRIRDLIGRGGMADVYTADDRRHDRTVAVKILRGDNHSEQDTKRFLREIRLAARLSHPGILPVFDSGTANGHLYYVMPYLIGGSLRHRLETEQRLDQSEAVRILRDVADALDYAHRDGIVHRDVKPENILFSHGHALLADFGIARLITGETLTAAGVAVGTPTYMSPEQLLGEDVGPPADVFSLGCVAYEMLEGCPPFRGGRLPVDLAHRVSAPPAMRSSRSGDQVVRRALLPHPSERYRTAGEFARALDAALAGQPKAPRAAVSLVVRPFEPVGADANLTLLCDGLTEEVIADLSAVRALRVISRTTAMHYKHTTKDARAISTELGVRYVVSGSVQRANTRVRVRGELVDALVDAPVWSGKFDGTTDDPFDLQERVSRAVVEALRIALSPEEERKLSARPIADVRAYEAYRLAHIEIVKFSREALERARAHLAHAIGLIGDNPLLLAARGELEWQYVNAGFDLDEARTHEAERWLRRALAVDPQLPQALTGLAWILASRGQMVEATHLLVQSLNADPTNSTTVSFYALNCWIGGRWGELRTMSEQLALIDPLHLWGIAVRGMLAAHDRRPAEVDRLFDIAMRLEPGSILFRILWTVGHLHAGQPLLARQVAEAEPMPEEHEPLGRMLLAFRAAFSGRQEEVRRLLAPDAMGPMLDDAQYGWHIADALALAGLREQALQVLSRAVGQGFWNVDMLATDDPCFAALRSDQQFIAILDRARMGMASIEQVLETSSSSKSSLVRN
jgi:eukaryotic-like serine/threonine-protein kinase